MNIIFNSRINKSSILISILHLFLNEIFHLHFSSILFYQLYQFLQWVQQKSYAIPNYWHISASILQMELIFQKFWNNMYNLTNLAIVPILTLAQPKYILFSYVFFLTWYPIQFSDCCFWLLFQCHEWYIKIHELSER